MRRLSSPNRPLSTKESAMPVRVIYHGHANVEIHSGENRIQIDPFYSGNPLADVPADKVNPTHILLTHAHGDHVGDAVALAQRTRAPVVANYEMCMYLARRGAPIVIPINHGGAAPFPWGRATMTIAFHTSSFEDGTYGGQPAGFVVEIGGKAIYHAGDTALFGDMKLIGELFKLDLACLPMGDCFTMGPAAAFKAAQFLGARMVLPMHYNTFPPIQQDVAKFLAELKAAGMEGRSLQPGESLEL
jgi:L-ascorbate metabolism protein UlaG (beta-lactamase superfamily)